MSAKQGTMTAQGIGSSIIGLIFGFIGGIYNFIKTLLVLGMVCLCAATFGLLVLILVRPDLKDEMKTGFLSASVTVSGMEESEVIAYKDATIQKILPYLPADIKQNVSGLLSTSTDGDAPPIEAGKPVMPKESVSKIASQVSYDEAIIEAALSKDLERGNPSLYLPESDAELIESLVLKYKKEHDITEMGPVLKGAIYLKFLDSLFKGNTDYVLMAKHMGTKPFLAAAKDNTIPEATSNYAKEVKALMAEPALVP